jgi:SAM-dependent methyltransferase
MRTLSDEVRDPAFLAADEAQRQFWNHWNASEREHGVGEVSNRQAEIVLSWLAALNRPHLDLLEVGCGAGWFCPRLQEFGALTATDLSDEVLERAQRRVPAARFVAGDFMALDFGTASFDVVVALEVLAHVPDQPAFLTKIAAHLRPGGSLMLATQNRPLLERHNRIGPPGPGQIRKWVDRDELMDLLEPHFETCALFPVTPRANRGPLRILASYKLNRAVRAVLGNRLERALESAGFGWTLMALARRRA